ncbi:MAG: hypothetical protein U1A73_22815 [Pseudomonas sp.]|nr:hypothetical protein [Pseudomonas sp.]
MSGLLTQPYHTAAIGVHDALMAPNFPPLAQKQQQISREHGIAVPSAFAAFNP